jgi:hypothetical protein
MVESLTQFDHAKMYAIKNVKCGKFIRTKDCKTFWTPLAADGIEGFDKERVHASSFRIIAK